MTFAAPMQQGDQRPARFCGRKRMLGAAFSVRTGLIAAGVLWIVLSTWSRPSVCHAASPNPLLNTVFPAGGKVGERVEVEIGGPQINKPSGLRLSIPNAQVQQSKQKPNRFSIHIPQSTPPGSYEVRAICANGVSTPRAFWVGARTETLELEPNNDAENGQRINVDCTVNGRIAKAGDIDCYRIQAKRGQRIVIECFANRLESRLRALLEVVDLNGRRIASNRGFFGVDPLIDFVPPQDGEYVIRLFDLIYAGGPEHYYRLDVDSGPRVAFASPSVVQAGKTSRITLFGWNLGSAPAGRTNGLDQVQVELPPQSSVWPLPLQLDATQSSLQAVSYQLPGGHGPILIGVTDLRVLREAQSNDTAANAQPIAVPCEISGRLPSGNRQDWYALQAKQGEVLYFEGFGQRIGSPLDLDICILERMAQPIDSTSESAIGPKRPLRQLAKFSDTLHNVGGPAFPTAHLDPCGRWVAPRDGTFLILVRDLLGGQSMDPRRGYRLAIRRETPDFSLVAVPRNSAPAALNVTSGGRTLFELLAIRKRGQNGTLRVFAESLPAGLSCPDVWLGPGVDRAAMVISADPDAPVSVGTLRLRGVDENGRSRLVRGGVVVRKRPSTGWGRLTMETLVGVAGQAPLRITANAGETRKHHLFGELQPRFSPGGIVDVAVQVERADGGHQAPVNLLGLGLPEQIANQTAVIPAERDKGYLSFYLPPDLPVGRYSLAIQAETTVPKSGGGVQTETVVSNSVSFDVATAAFQIDIDLDSPRRIKRGEVIQVGYSARRRNGFIGKIHTELAMPGRVTKVVGLRARGVTFVGQTEQGKLQIVANDDAPLGQQPFLRLYAVGVLEDEPVFHGSALLSLEVVE